MSDPAIVDTAASPFSINAPRALTGKPTPAAERAQVAELAQQFEAMLMLQMVQQMRKSLLDESEEPEGLGGDTMQGTFDTEFSQYLAQSGGVGLGAYMTRTLAERSGANAPAPAADVTSLARTVSAMHPLSVLAPAGRPLPGIAGASPASPALPAATPRGLPIGRSTDNTDAPASVELPLANGVTSAYGLRSDPFTGASRFHRGVDLRAAYGTEVPAAAGGTVAFAGERGTYGTLVVMRHANGVETRYAHLSSVAVKEGDVVDAGVAVGRVGSTGRSAAPHLHFEVLVNGERVDPAQWAGRVGRGPLKSDDAADD